MPLSLNKPFRQTCVPAQPYKTHGELVHVKYTERKHLAQKLGKNHMCECPPPPRRADPVQMPTVHNGYRIFSRLTSPGKTMAVVDCVGEACTFFILNCPYTPFKNFWGIQQNSRVPHLYLHAQKTTGMLNHHSFSNSGNLFKVSNQHPQSD